VLAHPVGHRALRGQSDVPGEGGQDGFHRGLGVWRVSGERPEAKRLAAGEGVLVRGQVSRGFSYVTSSMFPSGSSK
jgi:hypothetical protein